MAGRDIGWYTLPVLLSFDGIEKQATQKLNAAFGASGRTASKSFTQSFSGAEDSVKRR
jgi:hypothetical protein